MTCNASYLGTITGPELNARFIDSCHFLLAWAKIPSGDSWSFPGIESERLRKLLRLPPYPWMPHPGAYCRGWYDTDLGMIYDYASDLDAVNYWCGAIGHTPTSEGAVAIMREVVLLAWSTGGGDLVLAYTDS